MGSFNRDFEYRPRGLTGHSNRASSVFSASSESDSWLHASSSPARSLRSQTPIYTNHSHTKKFQNSSGSMHLQRRRLDGLQDNVVIKAGFNLLPPNISRTTFKTRFEPCPAHSDPETESARLSAQIKDFLKRSDHIEQDWVQSHPGRKSMQQSFPRDKINTAIAIRGFQMSHSTSWTTLDGTDSSIAQNSDALSLADIANAFDDPDERSISVSQPIEISQTCNTGNDNPIVVSFVACEL